MENLEQFDLATNSVCVHWKQPYMCYNGMDSFEYLVSVEAIDPNATSTATVNETSNCFPIDPCGSYEVTVTPSVDSYNGTIKTLPVNGLGGKFSYDLYKLTINGN